MIRALIFDCFGVLYRGSLEQLIEQCPTDKRQAMRDLSRASDYGYISQDEFVEQTGELLGKTSGQVAEMIERQHVRNKALMSEIQNLRKTYKIAMLSNIGREVIPQLFSAEELERLFDTVVLSSDEGMIKPDPEVYKLTADRLGVGYDECVMIDDSQTNCRGAEEAGMQAILFKDTQQCVENLGKLKDY